MQLVLATTNAGASSHREAPFVTEHPKVDATDFYMFTSYEPGREGYVTFLWHLSAMYERDENRYVYILDDGVLRYEADGRGSRTYRQVVQILKEDAVERWAEFSFSFEPSHEKLTVNWVRVVSPSGEIISEKPRMSKSRALRVTTVRPCSRAVAAIIVSRTGSVVPCFLKSTTSRAQRRLTVASHGKHSIASTTALNHSSSCLRLRPLGSARMPRRRSRTRRASGSRRARPSPRSSAAARSRVPTPAANPKSRSS